MNLLLPGLWALDGLCREADPEAWYPVRDKGDGCVGVTSGKHAKRVCARCPVRVECLNWALEHDERFGIWGGLSERERTKLRKADKKS